MIRSALFIACACVLGAACGGATARPQWIVEIDTDAPVPQLGDRMLVEVLQGDGTAACSACRREFGINGETRWPLSFGIESASAVHVRARLYRTIATGPMGLPLPETTIDTLARLPDSNGVTRVRLSLQMDCFGVEADVAAKLSCDPETKTAATEPVARASGERPVLSAGSWPPAVSKPCATSATPGMACVSGGIFLLGSRRVASLSASTSPTPEHLVVLSPFFLDRDELTVGAYRALVTGGLADTATRRSADPTSTERACTYPGPDDATGDALPLSCVSQITANAICAALGKRLPTEAEWEYAAGNLAAETLYPWGYDSHACDHAVIARGRIPEEAPTAPDASFECRTSASGTLAWGPVAGGHPLDVTDIGLRNMAGNVAEWTSDVLAPYDKGCWAGSDIRVDPHCTETPSVPAQASIRGGSWADRTETAVVPTRQGTLPTDAPFFVGLRCARSAE